MQITAHVYDEDADRPSHVDVLRNADLAKIRLEARRLLGAPRRARRVEVRFDGALMLTFLAPPGEAESGEAAAE
jgi:hypothetical protein